MIQDQQFKNLLDEENDHFFFKPYTYFQNTFISNHPLKLINDYKEPDLLDHPLTAKLINKKWSQFANKFYYFNLFYYCCFLASLTAYTVTSIPLSPQKYPKLYSTCSEYFNSSTFSNNNQSYIFPKKALEREGINYASRALIDIFAVGRALSVLFGRELFTALLFIPEECYFIE